MAQWRRIEGRKESVYGTRQVSAASDRQGDGPWLRAGQTGPGAGLSPRLWSNGGKPRAFYEVDKSQLIWISVYRPKRRLGAILPHAQQRSDSPPHWRSDWDRTPARSPAFRRAWA